MSRFRKRTVNKLADMICGNESVHFGYRSSTYLSEFFADCELEKYVHDGSTRKWWVAGVLEDILEGTSDSPSLPGLEFRRVIDTLMDPSDCTDKDPNRQNALAELNQTLSREGLEAFYGGDHRCHLRNTRSGEHSEIGPVTDRALSKEESDRSRQLDDYLDTASEDSITEK